MKKLASLIVVFIFTVSLLSPVLAAMSLDEMRSEVDKLLQNSKTFSETTDRAVKEAEAGNFDEAGKLVKEVIADMRNNAEVLHQISADSDYYYTQKLSRNNQVKFDKVNSMITELGTLMTATADKMKIVRQCVNEKAAITVIKTFSLVCESYFISHNKYPDSIDVLTTGTPPYMLPFEKTAIGTMYKFSYNLVDNNHYDFTATPKQEAVERGDVFDQVFNFNQDRQIIIKKSNGEVVKTVSIK